MVLAEDNEVFIGIYPNFALVSTAWNFQDHPSKQPRPLDPDKEDTR